jgi:hypothetical protein
MTLTDPFFSQYCTPKAEIAASLRVLFRRGDCFEIRVIDAQGSNKTDVGYFDDCRTAAASVVARYDGKTPAVYVVLNEMPHDMLARSANGFGSKTATADRHIIRRRWQLIDVDAAYPHDLKISSTDAEHEATLEVAERIRDALVSDGWAEPILADSGNGSHVLVPLDIHCPNDLATKRLKNLLKRLADNFDTPHDPHPCNIDTSVCNPAALTKLYGTMARKAANMPDRPYRRSHLLYVPASLAPWSDDAEEVAQ